jgi:hypothetical protein
VQALQHHPEYAMTLQARKENHTRSDRTVGRNTDPTAGRIADRIVGRTADRTAGRTAEVAVHDLSVCTGSVINAESRIHLRTVYPTDQEYQQTT